MRSSSSRGTEFIGSINALDSKIALLDGKIEVANDLGSQLVEVPGFGVSIDPTGLISPPIKFTQSELESVLDAVAIRDDDGESSEGLDDAETTDEDEGSNESEDESDTESSSETSDPEGQEDYPGRHGDRTTGVRIDKHPEQLPVLRPEGRAELDGSGFADPKQHTEEQNHPR